MRFMMVFSLQLATEKENTIVILALKVRISMVFPVGIQSPILYNAPLF